VSLPFERSAAFSFDKPADVPCPHLLRSNRCAVHDTRLERGLSGCVQYDCYGAGQRLTAQLLRGRPWREDAALTRLACEAFRVLKRVHELGWLLERAAQLELPEASEEWRQRLLRQLDLTGGETPEILARFDVESVERSASVFFQSLRHVFRNSGAAGESPCLSPDSSLKPSA
jgi:hypothetical protein